jgi:hypothetical protein
MFISKLNHELKTIAAGNQLLSIWKNMAIVRRYFLE